MQIDATNATLIKREDLTDILSLVWVRPDTGTVPAFTPGQFFRLGLPRGAAPGLPDGGGTRPGRIRLTRRAYSVASSPTRTEAAEFFVVRIEEGQLTPRLWELLPGDRLWMDDQAKGEFRLELAPPGRDLVMVSTGTGIAPFMSMLRTFAGMGRWRRFVLINGTRRANELAYRAELAEIVRADPTVMYIPLVSREPPDSGWTGLRGRVQTALEPQTYARLVGAPLDPEQSHVFLCGNPQMIDDVERLLETRGFRTDTHQQKGNIHFERYW